MRRWPPRPLSWQSPTLGHKHGTRGPRQESLQSTHSTDGVILLPGSPEASELGPDPAGCVPGLPGGLSSLPVVTGGGHMRVLFAE